MVPKIFEPLKFDCTLFQYLKGMDTFSEEATLLEPFMTPFGKGFTLKGKKLLPDEAYSFLLVSVLF